MSELRLLDESILVDSYQRLILLEARKLAKDNFREGEFNSLSNPSYCLRRQDIKRTLSDTGVDWEKILDFLESNGLIVRLGSDCYRTLHMDLLVRGSDTRTHPAARQAVILSKFAVVEQPTSTRTEKSILPSKDCGLCRELAEAIREYVGEVGADIAIRSISDYFSELGSGGYDPYQARAVTEALRGLSKGRRSLVITAPTGAGKTEVFLTVAFLTALRGKVRGSGGKVVLTYPRKMLEVDQMERIIMMAKAMNRHLHEKGFQEITIALRDGDTHALEERVRRSETGESEFRGIKCRGGKLYARLRSGKIVVLCRRKGSEEEYGFVIAEKNLVSRADIIVTNFQTLAYRLAYEGGDDLGVRDLAGTDMLVIDEAHEYDSIELQNIKYTLGMLSMLSELSGGRPPAVIISSATLPNHVVFAKELTGEEPVDISFEKLAKKERLMGRRLILYLVVMMSPFVSWQSYISELAAIYTYLHWRYKAEGKSFIPQAIVFINNVKEVNRAKSILDNALSLGSPIDNLCTELRKRFSACSEPPNNVSRAYRPYYELADGTIRRVVVETHKQSGNLFPILSDLYDVVFSGVPLDRRTTIYDKIKKKELALVYATTSLELGVDYPGVSIIINAGFDKATRLVQRIGRGGRSPDSMMTVLGIIVVKNNPADYRKLNDANFMRSLLRPGAVSEGREVLAATARLRLLQANAVLRAALIKAIFDGIPLPSLDTRRDEEQFRRIKEFLDALARVLKDGSVRSMITKHLRVEPDVIDEVATDIESFRVEDFIKWYRLASFLEEARNDLIDNINEMQKSLSSLANAAVKVRGIVSQLREAGAEDMELSAAVEKVLSSANELAAVLRELMIELENMVPTIISGIDDCIRPETACRNADRIADLINSKIRELITRKQLTIDGREYTYFGAVQELMRRLESELTGILSTLMTRLRPSVSRPEIGRIKRLANTIRELDVNITSKTNNLNNTLLEILEKLQYLRRGEDNAKV